MHAGPSQLPEMPQLRLIVDQLISGPNLYKFDVRRMKAGQLLCGSGDTAQGLLVVRQGRLRYFSSFEGKELTLFTLDAGDAIPLQLGSMLEAKTDGEIVIISEKLLRGLARSNPDLALSAMSAVSQMLERSLQMVEDMAFRRVKHRLVRALCEAAGRYGRKSGRGIVLDAPPNAEEFAMRIGATRQSVSKMMAELIRSGIVRRIDASAMEIADLKRLEQELS
jgi:CRP-like cAMP-binding protein